MSVAGALAIPGVARAESLADQANHLRGEVVGALGKRAPGRDIVRLGVLERNGKTRRPTGAELANYRDALARMLAPAVPSATPRDQTVSGSSSSGSATGSLPACTWQPESGGNWHAVKRTTARVSTGSGFAPT